MADGWHLAQYNIAWLRKPLEDPANDDFRANLERINTLGDRAPGFVWRLKTDDGASTSVRVRDDARILVNFTVWESADALFQYTYYSDHAEVFRRRKDWFERVEEPYLVLWWIPAGHTPTLEEAEERLRHLAAHGPTAHAFTFKRRFPAPAAAAIFD